MKIIVSAEYNSFSGVIHKRSAVVKIGEVVLTSVIPRDRTERDIINSSLEAAAKRFGEFEIGTREGYSG